MPDPSDEQLVKAFQGGDEVAFSTFVARHTDRVFRLALMWLKDGSLADDAVQETFLRTYTGLGRFRFGAQPTTWVLRILRNVCHEINRRRVFVPLIEDVEDELNRPDGDVDQDEYLNDRRRVARLRNAAGELPPRQRQVVALRIFEDLSIADTARIMGCREGTVKAHLNKAVAGLKINLEINAEDDT